MTKIADSEYWYQDNDIGQLLESYFDGKGVVVSPPVRDNLDLRGIKEALDFGIEKTLSNISRLDSLSESSKQDIVEDLRHPEMIQLLSVKDREKIADALLQDQSLCLTSSKNYAISNFLEQNPNSKTAESVINNLKELAEIKGDFDPEIKQGIAESLNAIKAANKDAKEPYINEVCGLLAKQKQQEITQDLFDERNKESTQKEQLKENLIKKRLQNEVIKANNDANTKVLHEAKRELDTNPDKKVVIPINHNGNHWSVAIVSKNQSKTGYTVVHNDSLRVWKDSQKHVSIDDVPLGPELSRNVVADFNKNFGNPKIVDIRIAQQDNLHDCGAWVVENAKVIVNKHKEIVAAAEKDNRKELCNILGTNETKKMPEIRRQHGQDLQKRNVNQSLGVQTISRATAHNQTKDKIDSKQVLHGSPNTSNVQKDLESQQLSSQVISDKKNMQQKQPQSNLGFDREVLNSILSVYEQDPSIIKELPPQDKKVFLEAVRSLYANNDKAIVEYLDKKQELSKELGISKKPNAAQRY